MKTIAHFKDDHEFLSNFYRVHVMYNELWWDTAEHAYQAAKTNRHDIIVKIGKSETPGKAKRLGQKIKLRPDWNDNKLEVMTRIVSNKFKNMRLLDLLEYTKGYKLVEGNNWHDNYWGDCSCVKCKDIKGQNHLGKILMGIRGFL